MEQHTNNKPIPLADYEKDKKKAIRLESLINLSKAIHDQERRIPISFNDFLYQATLNPKYVFRDVFQLFYDMFHYYIPQGVDDYEKSDESIGFMQYDCSALFVRGCDNPFFADRLFANRLMELTAGFRKGSFRNNIILFEGPPGSGKSTFLNILLQKFEDYAKTDVGTTYKVFWHIDLNELRERSGYSYKAKCLEENLKNGPKKEITGYNGYSESAVDKDHICFSCPNHDHPILMIPKKYRKDFLTELIPDKKFLEDLFNEKQYEWVLKDSPCNICSSLYNSLLDITGDPLKVYEMIWARKNFFSRQLGEGVSVFNPGDAEINKPIDNPTLQHALNDIFGNDDVRFVYSYLAKTNNGALALMDIKENNIKRLRNYHGIISDGVHKVFLGEEKINTIFLGLVNPADKIHYQDIPSFQDRIITVNIPYVLDYNTEIAIYFNKFGKDIAKRFLPRIIKNLARIIISSRLDPTTPTIRRWITNPQKYRKYLDKDMFLLKMDIYTGKIPSWIDEEDEKRFVKEIRHGLISDSKVEGFKGISGRQSLIVLQNILTEYRDSDKLITMEMIKTFFSEKYETTGDGIPLGFIGSLIDMYDYEALQEVKEAIYYFNKEQLESEILDYLFAINFDTGIERVSPNTGNTIEISEEFFQEFESVILGNDSTVQQRRQFRKDTHQEYITSTLSKEIKIDGKDIRETELFNTLYKKYMKNIKENALEPYLENDNFRRAILDYGSSNFNANPERLKRDVSLLITNLQKKFEYTEEGARQISLYVIDKKLAKKY